MLEDTAKLVLSFDRTILYRDYTDWLNSVKWGMAESDQIRFETRCSPRRRANRAAIGLALSWLQCGEPWSRIIYYSIEIV